jgi:hypothetical protein
MGHVEIVMANGENNVKDILDEFSEEPLGESDMKSAPDSSGLSEITEILISAYQVYAAARIARFSEGQAFQFARDYFTTMMRMSAEAQQ